MVHEQKLEEDFVSGKVVRGWKEKLFVSTEGACTYEANVFPEPPNVAHGR